METLITSANTGAMTCVHKGVGCLQITHVAVGKRKELGFLGNDYPTHDGTGVRDYIHVCDLAADQVAALKAIGKLLSAIAVLKSTI